MPRLGGNGDPNDVQTLHSVDLFQEEGIYQTARQLKKYNPNIKTTFYWHTGQARRSFLS